MGWDKEYLHCFHIDSKDYGIGYEGGFAFSDNPHSVYLDDFAPDVGDRFTYTYNFFDNWLNDIHIEAIESVLKAGDSVPYCTEGNRRPGPAFNTRLIKRILHVP